MNFDRLVYEKRESVGGVQVRTLTVDLPERKIAWNRDGDAIERICPEGDWKELCDLLAACAFERWEETCGPRQDAAAAFEWSVELFDGGRPVKRMSGDAAVPNAWPAFQSFVRFCRRILKRPGKKPHGRAARRSDA